MSSTSTIASAGSSMASPAASVASTFPAESGGTTTTTTSTTTTVAAASTATKKSSSAGVTKLTSFNPVHDCLISPMAGTKVRVAKLSNKDGKPLLLQIGSGKTVLGQVHHSFGVKVNELSKNNELTVTFTIDDQDTLTRINKLQDHLADAGVSNRSTWFPSSSKSDAELRNSFVKFMPQPKTKPDGTFYPVTMRSTIDPRQMEEVGGRRGCKVRRDGEYVDSAFELIGCPWQRIVIEFKSIYVQGSKSYGLAQRVRVLDVLAPADEQDVDALDSDDDEEEQPQSKRQKKD